MSKRVWAALAALLTFATVLAVVPLANAEPAEAHTKTKQRCSYDVLTGQNYNCRQVPVPHLHTSDNSGPPPDTTPRSQKCPTGTTGTPPDCLPIPPDNSRSSDNQDDEPPPTTTQPPPPPTTTQPPPVCPADTSGTPPNCVPDPCPPGTSGTPPNCVQDDGGTGSGCGHPSQHKHDKLGCHNRSSDHDTNPTRCGPRSAEHKHDGSGCHVATLDHCHDGEHSHEGSGCHDEDTEHGRGHDAASGRCTGRVPSHAHDGFGCHPVSTNHCHDGEHAHNGGGCHPIDHDSCPLGEHEHLTEQTSGCHPINRDHYPPREPSYFENISKAVLSSILCGGVGWAVAGPAGAAAGLVGCPALLATFETATAKQRHRMIEEAKRRHDKLVEAKNRQDKPSGGTTPQPTPDTTPDSTPDTMPDTTPQPTPDTTPSTTAPLTPLEAMQDAIAKFRQGQVPYSAVRDAVDAWQCSEGVESKCK